ncbi:MAG: carboxylesterase family protein [Bacteroidales bacterium]
MLSRRQFMRRAALSGVTLSTLPGMLRASFMPDYQVIDTPYGKLRGSRERGVNIFKGVPYAGSVSGKNRFLKAPPVEPWTGVRDALQLGSPSIQPPNQTYGINEPGPAEDCLVLNIWTPANDGGKRPVMVYNHGGGFRTGSGGAASQDGANLARMYDVVVVATNHRLGLLGHLCLDELAGGDYAGSGNRGVQDIAVALEWIGTNIALFGGDPGNVTIFGESGGGMKTASLYAMPEAAPYFHKASIESGPGVELIEAADAAQTARDVLAALQISPSQWQKLLEVPASTLLEITGTLPRGEGNGLLRGGFRGIGNSGRGAFGAMVDGTVIPAHPFEPAAPAFSRDKPLQVGWNEDEYIFFAMTGGDTAVFTLDRAGLQARLQNDFGEAAGLVLSTYETAHPDWTPGEIYIAVRSIGMMGLGSIRIAERKTAQGGAPAFLYNFGYKSNATVPGTRFQFGSMHALDIPFKFYNVASGMAGSRPNRFETSRNMTSYWTNFAHNRVPTAPGTADAQAYNLETRLPCASTSTAR